MLQITRIFFHASPNRRAGSMSRACRAIASSRLIASPTSTPANARSSPSNARVAGVRSSWRSMQERQIITSSADREKEREWRTLADIIRSHQIEYRDPPNVECCGVGRDPDEHNPPRARILGAYSGDLYRPRHWHTLRSRGQRDWTRDHSLEIEIPDAGK